MKSQVRLNPRLSAEVDQTVHDELPGCEDWTPFPIFRVLLRVVAIVSGNLFIGPDLCRHEVYLASAIDFTNEVTAGAQQIKRWPKWLRGFVVYFRLAPAVNKSYEHRRRMQAFLEPLVVERREMLKKGKAVPEDLLQWMVEKTAEHGIYDIEHLTDMQLLLTMAAIHTTTLSATGM